MFIKVAKLGAAVKEVMVDDNATLEQTLVAAEMSSEGYSIKVNGRTPCERLMNNDVITLVPAIKGGR